MLEKISPLPSLVSSRRDLTLNIWLICQVHRLVTAVKGVLKLNPIVFWRWLPTFVFESFNDLPMRRNVTLTNVASYPKAHFLTKPVCPVTSALPSYYLNVNTAVKWATSKSFSIIALLEFLKAVLLAVVPCFISVLLLITHKLMAKAIHCNARFLDFK